MPEWYQSPKTGRWFLFGVGYVEKHGGKWLGALLYSSRCRTMKVKRVKPSKRVFESVEEAMAWVEKIARKSTSASGAVRT